MRTYGGGTGIQAVLHQLLDDGAQIDDDLAGLDPMYLTPCQSEHEE